MKILFLHISDLHINSKTELSGLKINGIANVLRKYSDIDRLFIICTGDLANEGKAEEYVVVSSFFGKLTAAIKKVFGNKYFYLYIIPGNHDIVINDKYNPSKDDINSENLSIEFEKMNNYFYYLSNNKAVSNKTKKEFDITSDKIYVGDFSISINQINSAPFSTLKHNDKELHYVKYDSINKIDTSSDFNITMMHHSYDWFHEDVKTVLENKIKETDIVFYGHEHAVKTGAFYNSNTDIILLKAGAFDTDDYYNNTYFNVVVLSAENKKIQIDEYSWDKSEQLFISKNNGEFEINRNGRYHYRKDFSSELFFDEKTNIGLNLFDYFVFPEMRRDNDKKRVQDIKGLKKIVNNNKVISVSGRSETGRTTLFKYLYNDIRKEKMALFINSKDMNNSNIKRIIRSAISNQIDGQFNYEKFQQLPKESKVIFIDDYDRIENSTFREQLIKYLESIFEKIIISVSTDSVSDLKEKFKESFEYNIIDVSIKSFTMKQRKELINKISSNKGLEIDNNYSDDIDKYFKSIPALRFLGNTFVVNYINLVLSNGSIVPSEGKSNFDILFEQTLRKSIIDNSSKDSVDTYFKILELLCHKIHFNKLNSISLSSIDSLIKEYNDDYEKNVRTQHFIDSMMKARIFVEVRMESYMLTNKMYLSYFIAKAVWSRMMNERSYEDFNNILTNICFGINGEILMFIIYITQSFKLLNDIYEKCECISKDWSELSFKERNISFLYNTEKRLTKLPDVNDKKISEYKQKEIEYEILDLETHNITCDGIYDYCEEDVSKEINKLNSVFKYVELMARGIRSFNASMKADQKYLLIDGVYRNTNKFLYRILSEFDDEFIDCLCEEHPDVNKEKVKFSLINFLLFFTLSIYDHNLSLSTCKETYKSFDNYIKKSDESLIDIQFFELVYLDNSGKYSDFLKCLEKILRTTSDPCILSMVRMLVFRKSYTMNLGIRERKALIDLFNNNVDSDYKINHKKVTLALMREA